MGFIEPGRVGYVVKRYPRYSETFIVTEILAQEAAGLEIEIFSLWPPTDGHFQDALGNVRAPVTYLSPEGVRVADFWAALEEASEVLPDLWTKLQAGQGEEARTLYQAVRLAREARKKGIYHLHAHFASVATTVTRLAAYFAGIPYSFTAHAKDIFHESVQLDDLCRKVRDAAAVITVTDYNVQYLRGLYGPAAAHVQRIYCGLDLGKFPYAVPYDRSPQIVAVGRLVEKKGFGDLIEACAILARRGRHFACQIIGTGPFEVDLQSKIEQLGIETMVKLIGPRPQSEVIRHVQDAAIFAAPCVIGRDGNRDGLPTTLLEAMAVGTPCVSTDITGIPEVIHDGETGLMVRSGDTTALAVAIERLLTEPSLRVQLASRARRLIEAEFDIHRNAARLRAIFGAPARLREAVHGVF